MKRCPKHYWFEYDETQGGCQLCEREARKAQSGGQPGALPGLMPVTPSNLVQDPASLAEPSSHASAHAIIDQPDVEPIDEPREPVGDTLPPAPPPAPVGQPAASSDTIAMPPPTSETQEAEPPVYGGRPGPPPLQEVRHPEPGSAASPPDLREPGLNRDAGILSQLAQLRDNGVFTVVLIGFFAGGKTWFLNRVKHELGARFSVSPPPAPDGDEVRRTFEVEVHHALRLQDEKVRSFALVDIPGEMLTNLVSRDYRSAQPVIEAMKMAGALIVALPADEVLLSQDVKKEARDLGGIDRLLLKRTADHPILHAQAQRARELVAQAGSVETVFGQQGIKSLEIDRIRALGEDRGEDDNQRLLRLVDDMAAIQLLERVERLVIADNELTRFTQDLCFMTGLLSLAKQLDARGAPGLAEANVDGGSVQLHMTSLDYLPFKRPTFVAMTKADLVSDPDPLLQCLIRHSRKPEIGIAFDEDPLDTVREMRPSLASKLPEWFQLSKFDFVSAFHQHRDAIRIDYSRPCFGVGAVLNWISWAQRWDDLSRGERAAIGRARSVRRRRDGADDNFTDDLGGILDRRTQRA